MVHTELLAQAVPKSLLARDDTESETHVSEERMMATSFTFYIRLPRYLFLTIIGDKLQC